MITPYRLVVTFHAWRQLGIRKGRADGRGMHCRVEPTIAGYIYWTPNTVAEPAREGYGCFLLYGGLRAVATVRRIFRDHRVRQVSLRTNQDRTLLVYNRQADGRVTHYYAGEGSL